MASKPKVVARKYSSCRLVQTKATLSDRARNGFVWPTTEVGCDEEQWLRAGWLQILR
ncbi:hypothetical protein SESBI_50888 [Sesbania bispinosa]|nr:hypothetical protein SESBI_50888 [Sesbania bispinosa]